MFTLKFATDNSAFEGEGGFSETVRILRKVANRIEDGDGSGNCFDINGNLVGTWNLALMDDEG